MGAGGVGQRVGAANVDLQPAFSDPVEELRRMGTEQIRRMNVVHKDRVADLDALRDAGDLDRAGAAKHRTEPAQRAGPAQGIVLDFSRLDKNGGLASGLQRSPPTQCYRQHVTDIAAEQFPGMLVG